jgi:hypothetical protein
LRGVNEHYSANGLAFQSEIDLCFGLFKKGRQRKIAGFKKRKYYATVEGKLQR